MILYNTIREDKGKSGNIRCSLRFSSQSGGDLSTRLYISPFKCSRKSKGLRSRSLLPSAFCFCLLLTSFLLVSEIFFCFFIHWQAKSLSVHEKNLRQSLHWQAFCLSVNEFYIFLPVFDISLQALTSFLLVSEWKKYTASTAHFRLIWSLTGFLLVSEWIFFAFW